MVERFGLRVFVNFGSFYYKCISYRRLKYFGFYFSVGGVLGVVFIFRDRCRSFVFFCCRYVRSFCFGRWGDFVLLVLGRKVRSICR